MPKKPAKSKSEIKSLIEDIDDDIHGAERELIVIVKEVATLSRKIDALQAARALLKLEIEK